VGEGVIKGVQDWPNDELAAGVGALWATTRAPLPSKPIQGTPPPPSPLFIAKLGWRGGEGGRWDTQSTLPLLWPRHRMEQKPLLKSYPTVCLPSATAPLSERIM
jgi:hypothetical protein